MGKVCSWRPSAAALRFFCFFRADNWGARVRRRLILVDKSTQQMSVSVDGALRYQFALSTGRAGYGTPNGTYHPERLETRWFSKLYYNSPMPHSIFFHGGYAIHGSYEINRLGGPASHGCIRLHPANAATLFALVKSEGRAATTIIVSGSNPALARNPAPPAQPHGGWAGPLHARLRKAATARLPSVSGGEHIPAL